MVAPKFSGKRSLTKWLWDASSPEFFGLLDQLGTWTSHYHLVKESRMISESKRREEMKPFSLTLALSRWEREY